MPANTSEYFKRSGVILRHGLVNRFDAVSHGKLVNNLLSRFIKVNFPSFVLRDTAINERQDSVLRTNPFGVGEFDLVTGLFTQIMEEVFMQARVLHVVRSDLLLAFNFHTDVQANRSRNSRFIGALFCKPITNCVIF